jgi:hypothetical protein
MIRGVPPWLARILIGWPAATLESCLSASEASEGLILTMIRPLAGAAGPAGVWACIHPDCTIDRNNKTPAARLEHLNFLEVAIVMDGSDKGRLRANNSMNTLFLYRKETVLDGLLFDKAELIVL